MKQLRLGLDLGTSSVGWALLDENNKIIKKNGHSFLEFVCLMKEKQH